MKLILSVVLGLVLAGCASRPVEKGTLHYTVPQFEYERN